MGALHQFEKTSMTSPQMVRVNNYQINKGKQPAANAPKKADSAHQEIMQEANERLNLEVQRLKKALFDANKNTSVASNPAQLEADRKAIAEKFSQKYAAKMKQLESQYQSEVKKNTLLNIKMAKLETLLDEVYEAENPNHLESDDIQNIKKINQQLATLLEKLKV